MSSYISVAYLALFLPLVIGLYAFTPQKIRRWVLLIASWIFFWSISEGLIIYLLLSILSIHHLGIWLMTSQQEEDICLKECDRSQKKSIKGQYQKKQRLILTFGVLLHLGVLLFLKYSPFFTLNLNRLLTALGLNTSLEISSYVLPIGISFYTLEALSYLFDVYRRKFPADTNLLRLALFMSFFPQIMEGPICRYEDSAQKLWEAPAIRYQNLTFGLQRILFGVMKKMIVADRLNQFIKNVFGDYGKYDGFVIALAAIAYTFQLYMDFSGTMDVVIGSAEIFSINLPENFKRPFFSTTISEFWKRWHITLGTWFKDYIFFPLSMSKPLKKLTVRARKKMGNHFGPLVSGAIALLAVWLCNGLWHGAGWRYIFYGLYHFSLILLGNIIEPGVIHLSKKLHISRTSLPYRSFQILRTAILVVIGELFFRADSLTIGLNMFQKILTHFTLDTVHNLSILTFGLDKYDFLILLIFALMLFVVGIIQEKGISIREVMAKRSFVVRILFFDAMIMAIIIFGAYGIGYVPLDPIYASF